MFQDPHISQEWRPKKYAMLWTSAEKGRDFSHQLAGPSSDPAVMAQSPALPLTPRLSPRSLMLTAANSPIGPLRNERTLY